MLAIGDDSDADCRQQPYFQEALRRRKEAPKIAMPSGWGGTWRGEVHWAADAELRSLANRPLLVKSLGEVFWGPQYGSCSDVDAVLYRSKLHPSAGCLTLHFLQAVSHSHRADATAFHIDSAARVWTTPLNPPYKPKPNFCAIVVKSVILRGAAWRGRRHRCCLQRLGSCACARAAQDTTTSSRWYGTRCKRCFRSTSPASI